MPATARSDTVRLDDIRVSTFRIPTDVASESDGTYEWSATTLVLVETQGGGCTGTGYTYADESAATLIHEMLAGIARGMDVMATGAIWTAMVASVRNLGRTGIASMAISAVDVALWDLKARLLDAPLVTLFGAVRSEVPVYGSGGFTSYSLEQLRTY